MGNRRGLTRGKLLEKPAIAIPIQVFLELAKEHAVEVDNLSQITLLEVAGSLWHEYTKLLNEANTLLEYAYHNRGYSKALAPWGAVLCEAVDTRAFWVDCE